MGNSSSKRNGGGVPKKAPEPLQDELLPYDLPSGTQYWTCDTDGEAIIQFAPRGRSSKELTPAMTLHSTMKRAAEKKPNAIALAQEPPERVVLKSNTPGKFPPPLPKSEWRRWTYKEYFADCEAAAKALIKFGMIPHDSVSVFGFNCPEWFISQWGAQFAGGKVAGIYPSDTPAQLQFKANHSNSAVAMVEGAAQLEKFAKVIDELPYLKAIVCWAHDNKGEPLKRSQGDPVPVYTWQQFIDLGRKEADDELKKRIEAQKPGHACALIYTSGTTGTPKAVMISHDNLISEVLTVLYEGIPMIGETETVERLLSYLPLSHVAGMLVDIATPVVGTAFRKGHVEVYFARSYDLKAGSLGERLRSVRPTIFLGVPRVWEKVAEKLQAIGAKNGKTKKKIAAWAKSKGLGYQTNQCLGGSGKKPKNYGLAEKLILSKIKQALGLDQCKFGFTGAAPIKRETQVYFASLGININEVYGMSECTGATTWSNDEVHEWGSVGFALPGHEVRVFQIDETTGAKKECPRAKDLQNLTEEEQGEICYRGRHIMMGYMANPRLGDEHVEEIKKKNASAIDSEGWLHSGDKGALSARGMIRVTGRYKELIIGAGGENIAPVPIEDEIKVLCPAISNVMMIGDQRKFNIALITLKAQGATGELPGGDDLESVSTNYCSPRILTVSGAMRDPTLIQNVQKAIEQTNKNERVVPSNAAKIQKFTILPRDFSVETGELTATLKLKRSVVEDKHKALIDRVYASKDVYVHYGSDDTTDVKQDQTAKKAPEPVAAESESKKDPEPVAAESESKQETGDEEVQETVQETEKPNEEANDDEEANGGEGEGEDEIIDDETAKRLSVQAEVLEDDPAPDF